MGKYDARISRMRKMAPRRQEIEHHFAGVYHGTDDEKAKILGSDTIVLWTDDPEIIKHNEEVFDRWMHGEDDW